MLCRGVSGCRPGLQREYRVDALRGGEVVLCAGVFGSPQILHRSGVETSSAATPSAGCTVAEDTSASATAAFSHSRAEQGLSDAGDSTQSRAQSCASRSSPLLDHSVLPFMALGNWWAVHSEPPSVPAEAAGTGTGTGTGTGASTPLQLKLNLSLPPNSVHGWIYLDDAGRQLPPRAAAAELTAPTSPPPIAR